MVRRSFTFIIILFFTFSLLTWIFTSEKHNSISRLKESELNHLTSETQTIEEIFRSIATDLHFLSKVPELQNAHLLKAIKNNHAEEIFLGFSNAKKVYAQVRFLDTLGNEIIRVDRKMNRSWIVPDDKKQNKKGRYYFEDALKLPKGMIYVSPFDLNIENGEIEKPLNPMIRFAEPIYDNEGNKQGVVVLNYHGKNIIEKIAKTSKRRGNIQTYLINADSYFLIGPTPTDEWGFMFDARYHKNMHSYYPDAWKSIAHSKDGLVYNKQGFFIYKTVHPMAHRLVSSTGSKNAHGKSSKNIDSLNYYWKIVSFLPKNQFEEIRFQRYVKFYIIFFFLSFLVTQLLTSLIEKNRKAKLELQHSFELLEEKNETLRKSNETKNTFFSIIAHDLRNPIQVVMGYTGMLIENYHNMTIDEIKAYFKDIESATSKLLRLLENLLNWSRSQTEEIPMKPAYQTLEPIVETACQPAHMALKEKNISFEIDIPPRLSAFFDKNLIMTVIRNLVTNAIKFTPEGGIIKVIALPLGSTQVMLRVEDTGVGMSTDECDRLFQVDKKFSKSGTKGETGTGLGLILSKEFIDKSGGTIRVESYEGQGSTFIITLPTEEFRESPSE